VKAYRALNRFRKGAAFRPWLLRIVANEARNRHKAAGRRTKLALRLAEEEHVMPASSESPDAAIVADEQRAAVVDGLNQLREEDRTVIAYRYFFDLSEDEMAETLGIARGTVKSRLSRALDRLRKAVGAEHRVRETIGG
jgi:RNA polymerase sigma-70 factor, ECF subfamily